MCKSMFVLSLMVCSPAFASLAPLVGNDATVLEPRTEWLVSMGPLSITTQPHLTDDSTLRGSHSEGWLTAETSEILPLDPSRSMRADNPLENQRQPLSGDTNPPGKLALFIVLLIGAVIRFLTSSTFHDFLVDVYNPMGGY